MAEPLKCLLFDLDDTLVDSEAAYAAGLSALGLSNSNENYLRARQQVKLRLGPGQPAARNRLQYFKELLEHDGAYSSKRLLEMTETYEAVMLRHMKEQWVRLGRDRLFQRLSEDFTLAVLSNEGLRTQLKKLALFDPKGCVFRRVVTSEEAGVEKPHPKIFQLALAKLQAKPSEVLMIGDRFDADIEPALALGMSACMTVEFSRSPRPAQTKQGQLTIVEKLEEVEALLQI